MTTLTKVSQLLRQLGDDRSGKIMSQCSDESLCRSAIKDQDSFGHAFPLPADPIFADTQSPPGHIFDQFNRWHDAADCRHVHLDRSSPADNIQQPLRAGHLPKPRSFVEDYHSEQALFTTLQPDKRDRSAFRAPALALDRATSIDNSLQPGRATSSGLILG
jgi:hypothetical protein